MKATNLIIGQKYNWVRNGKPSYEVEYIGTDYCGAMLVYVFQYLKNDGKYYAELPVVHCEREIKEINLKDKLFTNGFHSQLPKLKEAIFVRVSNTHVFLKNKDSIIETIALNDITYITL